jgi:hypothetical protein
MSKNQTNHQMRRTMAHMLPRQTWWPPHADDPRPPDQIHDQLIMTGNLDVFLDGPELMADDTSLPVEWIPRSTILSVPFPIRPVGVPAGRWPGIDPVVSWQPWLWLPERLARPKPGQSVEEWRVSVALEMAASYMWDEDGSWLDVTEQIAGADPSLEPDRFAVWLAGGSDEQLDQIAGVVEDEWLPVDEDDPDWSSDGLTGLITRDGGFYGGSLMLASVGALAGTLTNWLQDPGVPVGRLIDAVEALPLWSLAGVDLGGRPDRAVIDDARQTGSERQTRKLLMNLTGFLERLEVVGRGCRGPAEREFRRLVGWV